MRRLKIKSFSSFYPIGIKNSKLFVQMGCKIGYIDEGFKFHDLSYIPERNYAYKLLNFWALGRRIFRLGCSNLSIIDDKILIFYRKNIYRSINGDKLKWEAIFSGFKGSRPLNPCCNGKELVFGEYFSNKERKDDVKIFSCDGDKTKVISLFHKGEIRHVHGCKYDNFHSRWLILTGDLDHESGLYYLSKEKLNKIVSGSQAFRAVDIIVRNENEIIIPSDTPLEKNYIRLYNVESKKLKNLIKVEGSVFHSRKISDLFIVTTVTEPSFINKTRSAHVYGSLDGLKWKEIISFKKDIFPIYFQKYTRYTELKVLEELFLGKYVVFEARATQLTSHGTIFLSYEEIISILNQ